MYEKCESVFEAGARFSEKWRAIVYAGREAPYTLSFMFL